MSKKYDDRNICPCARETSPASSPRRSSTHRSSSKRLCPGCRKKFSRRRSSTRKKEKFKTSSKPKNSTSPVREIAPKSLQKIDKKTRAENSKQRESSSDIISARKHKVRNQRDRAKESKRKSRKRDRSKRRRKRLSGGSSRRSRLVELLVKHCTCLKRFDSCTRTCNCHRCSINYETKSVQCDDYNDNYIPHHNHRDVVKKYSRAHSIDKEFKKTPNYVVPDKTVVFRRGDEKVFKKNSMIHEPLQLGPSHVSIAMNENKSCKGPCQCKLKNQNESTKPLLIMLEIIFWPYTCLFGRRSFECKNKVK